MCNKCMVAVNPNTISRCQSGCCKRLKFSDVCPRHPEEFYMFGRVCKKCVPNAVVESISTKFLYKSEKEFNKTSSAFGRDMSRVLWLALRASHKCHKQAYGWPFGPAICKFYLKFKVPFKKAYMGF